MQTMYRLKFYINAYHAVEWNGKMGQLHPHTWEIISDFSTSSDANIQFNEYEKDIMDYLKRYEDSTLNEVKPFDKLNPTVENFAEVVFNDLRYHSKLIENKIILQKLEVSEGPTRTYIIVNDDI
ncbi:6-carboxytetrahydropterin synthase [Weissella koreensis]|uniref:6-carboxytetrahydropterin synthase n=1 Tax=Weissella koreensis TaxID=165096 RepID=UPI0002174AFA|nr:6-carboxytetrahydropterin synthase [Weissella koreensis]AEJ23248.1 6-pyruvoyl-tetrahydropterin synthase-like protein [Weissella koreensis KACC 15510]AVH74891.1 6-pyruvoyl tetrahydropterin synthase [Weissella koreensis]EJF33851.1 hypothetical protein JC2156_06650 [Weissella koreensis KCTC 3621]MCZ9310753.1 6-carboxytetrahydropterin synthase [Weissella koreensis]